MKSLKVCASALAVSIMLVVSATASAATAELFASTNFITPDSLAIDGSGNVYASLSQMTTKDVAKIASNGTANLTWKSGLSDYPYDLAIGPSGSVVVQNGYTKIERLDASGTTLNTYTGLSSLSSVVTDSAGNIWWTNASRAVGRIPVSAGSGAAPSGVSLGGSEQAGCLAVDAAGNAYVGMTGKVVKFDSSGSRVSPDITVAGVDSSCAIATSGSYGYVTTDSGMTGGVARFSLDGSSVNATWVASLSPVPKFLAVGADGNIYTVNRAMGMGSSTVSKITPAGVPETLASFTFTPNALALDSQSNVYIAAGGMSPGVYRIVQAAPAPAPTPSSNSSSTSTTTTTTGKPAPGPALKVTDIPAEITLDLGSSTGGTIPADQPITAEVPCAAPEGQLLDRCTVNVTAPEYVLLGQGDGISVRSDKKVSIGKATVKSKAGKKTIVVKVTINPKGRKALQRNLKITATVGLTAITVSNLKSSGEANTEMRLPTQLISPESGIFDSNSISLNKAGVAFVNRLALLLPKTPKQMTFIGFADNTGVPGDNRWLGDRRAKAVRDALEAKGITAAKSSIETKAARSPRDDNAKQSGRERNRRVSIRITY